MAGQEKVTLLATLLRAGELPELDITWLNGYAAQYKLNGGILWKQIIKPLFLASLEKLSREDRECFNSLREDEKRSKIQSWAEFQEIRSDVTWKVHNFLGQQARDSQLARKKELIEQPCEVEELRKENAGLKKNVTALEEKLQKQEKKLEILRKENEGLNSEIKHVEKALDLAWEEIQQLRHSSTDAAKADLQEANQRLEKDNTSLREKDDANTKRITELISMQKHLEELIKEYQHHTANLIATKTSLQKRDVATTHGEEPIKEDGSPVVEHGDKSSTLADDIRAFLRDDSQGGSQASSPSKPGGEKK